MLQILLLFVLCFTKIECDEDTKTATACEFQSLTLQCITGEVILVKNANYGRTNGHTCWDESMSNRNCYAGRSLNVVNNACNNKQKCVIEASNRLFGDPCAGTYKYLTVDYQCIPALSCKANEFQCYNGVCVQESLVADGFKDCPNGEDELGADYESAFACQGQTLNLYCKRDEVVSIINANYGRLTSKICTDSSMSNQNCKSSSALEIVKNRCNEKGHCSVPSTNQLFGNPCSGTSKYLEIHYECIRKPACTEHEFQCHHGHCIKKSLRCNGIWDCPNGEDEKSCNYLTEYTCENRTLSLECRKDDVLKIIGANYGRQLEYVCTQQPRLNCLAPISKKKVVDRCNGSRACSISASNAEFGDPCYGTNKYLRVNYECVNRFNNTISPEAV